MKTTQGKVMTAFGALNKMVGKPMNSALAFKLFRLKKSFSNVVEFQAEQEEKLAVEYGGEFTGNGTVHFSDNRNGAKFVEARNELGKLECDVEIERFKVNLLELPQLSIGEIEALDEFIDWVDE